MDLWVQAYLKVYYCYESQVLPAVVLLKKLKKKRCKRSEQRKRAKWMPSSSNGTTSDENSGKPQALDLTI